MFAVNDSDIKQMESDLKTFASKALPFATRNTVNGAAFEARKIAQTGIRENMVNRNRFTVQSVRVEQTRTLNIRNQAAIVGSIADYMADQEFGAIKNKTGKEGVVIATSYSAGQGEDAQPRTRLPRKPNKMANIQLQKRRKKGSSRKQQNLVAIKQAAKTGRKYVFLDLGRRQGIFKVIGGKRRPKIKMVHDMTSESVVIPKNPWLKPAVDKVDVPKIYRKSLEFQLKRQGLFRNR